MKKFLFAIVLMFIASTCHSYFAPVYDVEYSIVKVVSGTTLWEIADSYYLESKAGNMCFEDYLWHLKNDAKNAKLSANGRCLQVGDIVYVPKYVKK